MTHHLTIEEGFDGLRLKLDCTATPDAPCRMRPSDDRETWNDDDPDLTAGHECRAVEWAEDGGWETVAAADDVTWPRIPVSVECDEGVIIAPIAPQPTLDGEVL